MFVLVAMGVAVACVAVACGARTDLEVPTASDARPDDRGDAPPPPDAGDALDVVPPPDVPRVDVPPRDVPLPDVPCVPMDLGPPRPIAPLSTARVSRSRVSLRWGPSPPRADATRVEICRDRDCTRVVASSDVVQNTLETSALAPGVTYWRLRSVTCGRAGSVASPTWQFVVDASDAPLPTWWGTVPDFNGDGFADIAVGAYGDSSVYIYRGSAGGPLPTPQQIRYFDVAQYGFSVASAGDVNGDGFADLVVGTGASSVMLHHGSREGPAQRVSVSVRSPTPLDRFGLAVSSAGDVDGDGYGDIIVGAQNQAAVVLYGSAAGVTGSRSTVLRAPDNPSGFALSVSHAGDINADGFGDVIVGANGSNRAYVYIGGTLGIERAPTSLLIGPVANADFGYSVASAGDVNNDGFADVIVDDGAPNRGGYVLLGSRSGVIARPIPVARGMRTSGFTMSVSGAGDTNGDGFGDVVWSAGPLGASISSVLFLGGASGFPGVAVLSSPRSDGGYGVAGAGDINGDGRDDVLVSSGAFQRVYVYFGAAGAPSPVPGAVLEAPAGAREFGFALAGVGR